MKDLKEDTLLCESIFFFNYLKYIFLSFNFNGTLNNNLKVKRLLPKRENSIKLKNWRCFNFQLLFVTVQMSFFEI